LIKDLDEKEYNTFLSILRGHSITKVGRIRNLSEERFNKLTHNRFLLNGLQKLRKGKPIPSSIINTNSFIFSMIIFITAFLT